MFEENFWERSIYLSFPQYVGVVLEFLKSFVEKSRWHEKQKKLFVFTGLCITPIQWFNYHIVPAKGKKILEIMSMNDIACLWADIHWVRYHEYLVRLCCQNYKSCDKEVSFCVQHMNNPAVSCGFVDMQEVELYRCILTVEDKVKLQEGFYLPHKTVVEKQLNDITVQLPDGGLVYIAEELENYEKYKKMPKDSCAYHIRDCEPNLTNRRLGEVLAKYFQLPNLCNISYNEERYSIKKIIDQMTYDRIYSNRLPLDFIIFGYVTSSKIEPLFALGCDVSDDKVRLSLLGRNNPRLSVWVQIVYDFFLK